MFIYIDFINNYYKLNKSNRSFDHQKFMKSIINIQDNMPSLSLVKTVTQILPYQQGLIIIIGHNPQSLKKLEVIYEIHNMISKQLIRTGTISKFGITFLTNYVCYLASNSFIILINQMGIKKIWRQCFGLAQSKILIKQIKSQKYQQKSLNESFAIYYSFLYKQIFMLSHLKFNIQEYQIIIRVFSNQNLINSYRIISLQEQIPQLIFSPQKVIFSCRNQIVLYNQIFQPTYYNVQNMEQFDILGYYNDLILQLKENQAVFTMTLSGVIRPLIQEPVVSFRLLHQKLIFLVREPLQRKSYLKIFKPKGKGFQLMNTIQTQLATCIIAHNPDQIILGPKTK